MSNNKHSLIELLQTRNLLADTFIPIARRPKKSPENWSIICAGQLGVQTNDNQEITNIQHLIKKISDYSIPYLILNDQLGFNPSDELVTVIKDAFRIYETSVTNLDSILSTIFSNTLREINITEPKVRIVLEQAIKTTLDKFIASEQAINASKLMNITVKLMYWIQIYINSDFIAIHPNPDGLYINPKIIYLGQLPKHAAYFLLMLSHLGCDILLFNFEQISGKLPKVFEEQFLLKSYDKKSSNEHFKKIIEPPKDLSAKEYEKDSEPIQRPLSKVKPEVSSPMLKRTPLKSSYLINFKKFHGNLEDLLLTSKERSGFIGEPSLVLPTYFVRYIGSDMDENIYKNKLFYLNEKLSATCHHSMLIENSIPMVSVTQFTKKTAHIWSNFDTINSSQLSELSEYLLAADLFSFVENMQLRDHCYNALLMTLSHVYSQMSNINISILKNTIIKLTGWFSQHYTLLLQHYTPGKGHNPKVIYHGDIKQHEAIYLIFLYYNGVDILFINSFQDNIFEQLDSNNAISTVHILEKVIPQESFPKTEVMVQHQTIASRAEKEIADVLHNNEDGVYLPWQFESFKTMPITLRTTYEELFILWNEDARIRSGFKVNADTIFVPNLFVKISGTHDNLSDYYKHVNQLYSAKETQFYTELPFTTLTFSIKNLSALDLAFENHTTLSFEKLKKHPAYSYNHLSDTMQLQIFQKIKMLLETDLLVMSDDKLKLKIVYTILNLNKDLLKLIQNFDYPAKIPKLVIYDSTETIFSESDAITMAFLYIYGFDICVITPTGYNNLEQFIGDKYYNTFKLANKSFDLSLSTLKEYANPKNKSFWSGLFK